MLFEINSNNDSTNIEMIVHMPTVWLAGWLPDSLAAYAICMHATFIAYTTRYSNMFLCVYVHYSKLYTWLWWFGITFIQNIYDVNIAKGRRETHHFISNTSMNENANTHVQNVIVFEWCPRSFFHLVFTLKIGMVFINHNDVTILTFRAILIKQKPK